jgi:hypothetical protein
MVTFTKRSTGTTLGCVTGGLNAGLFLFLGFVVYLVPVPMVPDGDLSMWAYFALGAGFLVLSMFAYLLQEWAKVGLAVGMAAIAVVCVVYAVGFPATSEGLAVAATLLGNNVLGAVSAAVGDDIKEDGRNKLDGEHATDIGTGYR